jgi:hypothetical protein
MTLTGGPQLSQQGDMEAGSYVAVQTTLNQSKQGYVANYTRFVKFSGPRLPVFEFEDYLFSSSMVKTKLQFDGVGDSPRGPLKQLGNPHLKPTTNLSQTRRA